MYYYDPKFAKLQADLVDEFRNKYFCWVQESDIDHMAFPCHWKKTDKEETWVETAVRDIYDLKDHPHLVFCSRDLTSGVVRRIYRPL